MPWTRACNTICLVLLGASLLLSRVPAHAACGTYREGPPQAVQRVYDGDTLLLRNGTQIRLVGFNTPELGHGEGPDEPQAAQARDLLQRLIQDSDSQIRVKPAEENRDRHGRTLAYVYGLNGRSLGEAMVTAGLGVVLAIPPNLAMLNCLQQAEAQARRARKGVWQRWPLAVQNLNPANQGFAVISGQVRRVVRSRQAVWVNLDQGLALRIDRDDLPNFTGFDFTRLEGQTLEARGWLRTTRQGARIGIQHPALLQVTGPTRNTPAPSPPNR